MRTNASARAGSGPAAAAVAAVGTGRAWTPKAMTRNDDPRRDFEEPTTTDARCAGFDTENGHVLYDPENGAAWLRSDTVLDPAEVA